MFKKFLFSFIVVLFSVGVISAPALALEGDVGPDGGADKYRPRVVRGEISALAPEGDSFDLAIRNGETLTFFVTEDTQFRGQIGAFDELKLGDLAAVGFVPRPGVGLIARQILVHEQLARVRRVGGKIAAVNLGAGTFALSTSNGEKVAFQTGEETRFQGAVSGVADLVVNQIAQVAYVLSEEPPFSAQLVFVPARQPGQRFLGRVQSIDLEATQFTLETRRGDLIKLVVDDQTKFRSLSGEIDGLGDLAAGFNVAATGVPQADGNYVAKWVVAVDRPLPKIPIRVRGKIIAASQENFSIETAQGETLDFIVTGETIFRSPAGGLFGLNDLEPGMRVGVGAEEISGGDLQANIVLVGAPID